MIYNIHFFETMPPEGPISLSVHQMTVRIYCFFESFELSNNMYIHCIFPLQFVVRIQFDSLYKNVIMLGRSTFKLSLKIQHAHRELTLSDAP